jgi:hypothetical protein
MSLKIPHDWFFLYLITSCPFYRVPEQNLSRCAPAGVEFLYDEDAMLRNGIKADPVQYTAAQIVYTL